MMIITVVVILITDSTDEASPESLSRR
jgi:hypothetical protein